MEELRYFENLSKEERQSLKKEFSKSEIVFNVLFYISIALFVLAVGGAGAALYFFYVYVFVNKEIWQLFYGIGTLFVVFTAMGIILSNLNRNRYFAWLKEYKNIQSKNSNLE